MKANRIRATVRYMDGPAPEGFSPGSRSWRVTLRYQGRALTVPFHQGPAIRDEPTAADVLECLASDASSAEQPFEQWCGDYGENTDSRKAEATYKAVVRQTKGLRRLLGDDFEKIVFPEGDSEETIRRFCA